MNHPSESIIKFFNKSLNIIICIIFYIFGIIQSATVISTLICLYKVRERERERERILKICGINNSLHPQWSRNYNKLNDINYRVKWAMGNWYNKAQIITLPNGLYFSNDYSKPYYPLLKDIMRNTSQFLYAHGDVEQAFSYPCFTKTRPIDNKTNIIILIEYHRHWGNVFNLRKRDIPFDKKKPIAIWRGTTTGNLLNENRPGNRFSLIKKWYDGSEHIDVGFSSICQKQKAYTKYVKGRKSIKRLLQYKYLICAEGNDVSSGLKWMLYSQSVVLMPKPTIVSWFMEDHLVPFKHYVPIKDDWSDLLEMFQWCEDNQDKCKNIKNNANNYVQRFIEEFDNGFAGMIHNEITRMYRKNISFETKG